VDETFGRYRLLGRLGHGGMAEVFKAKSFGVEGFEKVLVIKRILPELAKSKRFSDLFVHEAKLAVRLSHANIVQVFDLGTADGAGGPTYYIAMEYVAGLDLATLLTHCREQRIPLAPSMCVYIAAEVAKGLDHAHRKRDEQMRPLGIVHRDVSPQNVLISWEGEVKVTDFGIAKARDMLAATEDDPKGGQLQGKYPYMSPEQARDEHVDARSDLFSLGTVLYEMVTGVNPFRASTTFETIRRVRAAEYPPLELIRPDAPKALAPLLDKALAHVPDARYSDAGRMYESMLAYLYASGDRFGANDLATFVRRFRRTSGRPPSLQPDVVVAESVAPAPEATPIEVPSQSHLSPIVGERPSWSLIAARASDLGERREVTALVLRFGGRARALAAERRERVRDVITRYGGHLLEDDPSHAAAVFGLGEADGRDTETAVRCALIALRRTTSTPSEASPDGLGDPGPSAGIHSGRILLSAQGDPQRDERLTALLSTAQEMARLRDRACGVSVSASRNIRGQFVLESVSDTGTKPSSALGFLVSDLKVPGEGLGKFVGRKPLLKRFGEVFSLATRGRVFIVTLRGVQGVGKTRLLHEIDRRLKKGHFKVAFYLASCPPSGAAIALSGLTAMLQVLCGIKEGDSEDRILEVEPRLRALGLRDEEVTAVLFQLGGTARAGSSMAALRGALARMIVSLSSDQLHVFTWDHAQALDAQSFEMIESVVQRIGTAQAVFVFASRGGTPHPLERLQNHETLEMGELDSDETRELLAQRTGVRVLPEDLLEFCRERAQGHPLFIEELVKELFDSRALVVESGAVVDFRPSGDVAMPRPLRALMATRASRLPPEERRGLQAAAIMGDPVDLSTLSFMLDEPLVKLDKIVASLESRGFVRRAGTSMLEFVSPVLREVVVDALPAEARREMHAAAGAAYEAALGERTIEQADRVATHFFEAGDRDRAARYFARSGQRKLLGRHYEAATRDMIRALELCDLARHTAAELGSWLSHLASAVYRARTAREVPELMGQLLSHIDRTGDLATRVAARVDLASVLVSTHDFDGADICLEAAKGLAEGNLELLGSAVLTEAELARRRGDYLKAMHRFEEVAKLDTQDQAKAHRTLMGLALAYAAAGAETRARSAIASAEKLAAPDDLALSCERAKLDQLVSFFSRDFVSAVETGQKAVELARRAGLTYEVAINLHILGESLLRNSELPRAYACFQQSTGLCEEIAEERLRTHNRSFLAYLDASNDQDAADAALGDSAAYAHAHNYSWDEVNARYLLAKLHQTRGRRAEARAEFERCSRLAGAVGFRLVEDDCRVALNDLAR
jgi:serine/threonine protein kinase/tetratricopeptide (TPR) repeat protein